MCYSTIAEIKHNDKKQPGSERVYLILKFSDHTPSLREDKTTQDRKLKVEAEAEIAEQNCILPCSPWLAHPAF